MNEPKICLAADCGKPARNGRLCHMHAARKHRGGSLEPRQPKKTLAELLDGRARFGKWTVIAEAEGAPRPGNGTIRRALCRCDCGTEGIVHVNNLKRGGSSHCGCEVSTLVTKMKTTHGACRTSEYQSWAKLKDRCLNPNNKDYPNYGGRGIRVCDRWLNDAAAFLVDMGPKPTPNHSIDRIDVNGNYEPGNCRWATNLEQRHNQRPRRKRRDLD